MSRSFAYEQTAKYMAEICKNSCLQLKSANNEVTGCQFKRNGDFREDEIVPESTYYDCMFFMGIELAPAEDPQIDQTSWCWVLNGARDVNFYNQIRQVSRKKGDLVYNQLPVTWVLLRLPENDQIKTRVRQIVIDNDLSNKPGLILEVLKKSLTAVVLLCLFF